jgi:hypothetical protein
MNNHATTTESLIESHSTGAGQCCPGGRTQRGLRSAALMHLIFGVLFVGDVLVHTFYFPYLQNTVAIRLAAAFFALMSFVLAGVAFIGLRREKGGAHGGSAAGRNALFKSYEIVNLYAILALLFLLLLTPLEVFFMLYARYHVNFWPVASGGAPLAPVTEFQLNYANHPLWAVCLCYAVVIIALMFHLCSAMAACRAHYHCAASHGTCAANGQHNNFRHTHQQQHLIKTTPQ